MRLLHATVSRTMLPWLAAVILATLTVAVTSGQTSAHARLTASNPTSGSALAAVPPQITLSFSEEIDPAFSTASLLAADSSSRPIGRLETADDHLTLVVPITDPTATPPGTYTL